MTYYMYIIQTLIKRCTISEILAEIDHKGPNLTFLTWKITFIVIPYHSYFRTGLVLQQRSYMMQYIWAALPYYWIIAIIMGKWAKPDLSDLENDLNSSLDSWSTSSLRSCIQAIKKSYQTPLRKLAKSSKTAKFDIFLPFGPWKITFRVIQSNASFDSSLVPSLGSFLHK